LAAVALNLTENTIAEAGQSDVIPNIVLEIDGIETLYSGVEVREFVKIGPALTIGNFIIGGSTPIDGQEPLISLKKGTTTSIKQTLKQDKGLGNTITSMRIALVDKDEKISKLITPGGDLTDPLAVRAKVWYGLSGTNWREDYIVLHRGVIDEVTTEPGLIILNIASPQKLLQSTVFTLGETELTAAMGAGDTVADVDSTADFLAPVLGPDGTRDLSLSFYLKIEDEIIEYDAINSGTQFGATLVRGALGTLAASHDIGESVESFYRLEGNIIDLALKLMLSGSNGPYLEDIAVSNFVKPSATETVADSVFFNGVNVIQRYNIQTGDYITTTLAGLGANNVVLKEITDIVITDIGSYLVVAGAGFVEEIDSPAVVAFRSKYDTLGEGARMSADEVDIDQFLDIKSIFLSTFDYDIYIDDTIESLKDWLGKFIYLPAGCYELPRKARSSLGIHQGPLPTINIKTLNIENIVNPSSLKVTRSINRNFYNTIVHHWEVLAATPDKSIRSRVGFSQLSRDQIDYGNKVLEIEAKGFRDVNNAENLATQAQDRILRKYKFAAETIRGVELSNLKTSLDLEIGDIVSLDMASIKATDIKEGGTRAGAPRLFEVENRTFDTAAAKSKIDLIDTNFSNDTRFGTWSPSSYISKDATLQNTFIIKPSFHTDRYGANEWRKWEPLIGASVRVRNADFTIIGTALLQSVSGNSITVNANLGFLPLEDYLLELDIYDNQPDEIKLVFGFWSDDINNFADGGTPYQWY
jgi:hypothetical protein